MVLLDEIEKASPMLLNLFLQAFDEGWLTDGRGRRVYLSDAVVIMTSNVGSEHFQKLQNPFGFRSGQVRADQVHSDVRREMEKRFSPEFRNRIDEVVVFEPLSSEQVRRIAQIHIDRITTTLNEAGKSLVIGPGVLDALVTEGHNVAYGARFLKRVIDDRLKLPLSRQWKDGVGFPGVDEGGRDRRGAAWGRRSGDPAVPGCVERQATGSGLQARAFLLGRRAGFIDHPRHLFRATLRAPTSRDTTLDNRSTNSGCSIARARKEMCAGAFLEVHHVAARDAPP